MDYKNKREGFFFFFNEKWMSGMGRFNFMLSTNWKKESNAKTNHNVLPLSLLLDYY